MQFFFLTRDTFRTSKSTLRYTNENFKRTNCDRSDVFLFMWIYIYSILKKFFFLSIRLLQLELIL